MVLASAELTLIGVVGSFCANLQTIIFPWHRKDHRHRTVLFISPLWSALVHIPYRLFPSVFSRWSMCDPSGNQVLLMTLSESNRPTPCSIC